MEKRLLLAIVLSFLVIFLYQLVFVKKLPIEETTPEAIVEAEKSPDLNPPPKEVSSPEVIEKKDFQPTADDKQRQIIIDTPLYRAAWSNKGALLKSWMLKEFLDENKEDLELISPSASGVDKYPFMLSTEDPQFDSVINDAFYTASPSSLELKEGQTGELRFLYADDRGNKVEKTFTFIGGKYEFDIQIQVWKNGEKIEPRLIWGPSFGRPSSTLQKKRFMGGKGIAIYSANKVFRQEEMKYKPEQNAFNFVTWAAYEDNYFAVLFLTSGQKTSAVFLKEDEEQVSHFFLSLNYPQKAYIGPKEIDALNEFGSDAKKLIKFGFFGFIAEILLKAIRSIHSVFPNWGFSIIILTLLIKIIFFPLTYSSTKSMSKMQELQPKIKALRAKYKKAKQDIGQRRKMNEEIMKLYKEQGINPAGGCLPILIQLPIFWGFFRLLSISLEFRHSPFILWISDLSVKDPYYVTPILMGATQLISQKMTPTSADPSQQKMMLIRPVVMTIFFMNFQSGLVLYWLTNNVLQIGQQYIMNRIIHKKKRESHGKRRKK